jgi:hypothetical protein
VNVGDTARAILDREQHVVAVAAAGERSHAKSV